MNDSGTFHSHRRQFLVSVLSLCGYTLSLGSAIVLSGCGDDKTAGPIQNAVDPTKTQAGQDSMKAYLGQMKDRGKSAGKK